jgi:quinoprotein glucose dehydrogenase
VSASADARPSRRVFVLLGAALLTAGCGGPQPSEGGSQLAGWSFYGADPGGSRFSAADQIDRSNVAALEEAWRIRTGELDVDPEPPDQMSFQATPILVGGLLVLPTPLGQVIALDPETGAERWRFARPVQGRAYPELTSRGVAAFEDPLRGEGALCRQRVFAATV